MFFELINYFVLKISNRWQHYRFFLGRVLHCKIKNVYKSVHSSLRRHSVCYIFHLSIVILRLLRYTNILKPSAFTRLLQAVILVHEMFCHHFSRPIIRVCNSCSQIVIRMIISLQLKPNGTFVYIFIYIFTTKQLHCVILLQLLACAKKVHANCCLIVHMYMYIAYSYSEHMWHQNHTRVPTYIHMSYNWIQKCAIKKIHSNLVLQSSKFPAEIFFLHAEAFSSKINSFLEVCRADFYQRKGNSLKIPGIIKNK